MATQGSSGSGSGGGFGAFPYRSSHQQGSRTNRGGQRQSVAGRKSRNEGGSIFRLEIQVPIDRRAHLIGQGGSVIKDLQTTTNTKISVPGRNNTNPLHSVRITGNHFGSVLYATWKASKFVIGNESVAMRFSATLRGKENKDFQGSLRRRRRDAFLVEENEGLLVYCLETSSLNAATVYVIVDNEVFVDPSIRAHCDILHNTSTGPASHNASHLAIIIYGTIDQHPEKLFYAIEKAETESQQTLNTSESDANQCNDSDVQTNVANSCAHKPATSPQVELS
jgi:KH domain